MYLFKPQKVLHLKDELKKKNPKLHGTYIITEKFNGWFVYFYYNSKTKEWSSAYSSAGRKIPSLEWTAQLLSKFPKPSEDSILIAEAYHPDIHFSELNGLLNRTTGNCAFPDCIFMAHDLITVSKASTQTAKDRRTALTFLLSAVTTPNFKSTELLLISNYDEYLWRHKFDEIVNRGGEGIVAKRISDPYFFGKRNSSLIKLKMECTVDTLAVRLEERIGEKGNDSLVLISERKNGTEISTVISRHSLKEQFRQFPETVIGKVVEIKAMEELESGQLIQPVFVRVRSDKGVNDYV